MNNLKSRKISFILALIMIISSIISISNISNAFANDLDFDNETHDEEIFYNNLNNGLDNDIISNIKVENAETNSGKDFKLVVDLVLPDYHEYKAGDKFTITFPEEVKVNDGRLKLSDYAEVLIINNKITITLTEEVSKKFNVTGYINAEFKYIGELEGKPGEIVGKKIYLDYDGELIEINLDIKVPENSGQNTGESESKTGRDIRKDALEAKLDDEGNIIVDWVIELNGDHKYKGKTSLVDEIKEGHSLVAGSVSITRRLYNPDKSFIDDNFSVYGENRDSRIYRYEESPEGFRLDFEMDNTTYLINYSTILTNLGQDEYHNEVKAIINKDTLIPDENNYTPYYINNLEGDMKGELKSLQIIKEDTITKERLEGAKFQVYKELDEEKDYLFATVETNEEGIAKIDKLTKGKYYIKEIQAPSGYKLSEEKYRFTPDEKKITIGNEKMDVELENIEIEKIWANISDTDNFKTNFILLQNNIELENKPKIEKDRYIFEDLPKYDDDNKEYKYSIREKNEEDNKLLIEGVLFSVEYKNDSENPYKFKVINTKEKLKPEKPNKPDSKEPSNPDPYEPEDRPYERPGNPTKPKEETKPKEPNKNEPIKPEEPKEVEVEEIEEVEEPRESNIDSNKVESNKKEKEIKIVTEKPKENMNVFDENKAPQTGDEFSLALNILVLMASILGLYALSKKRK